MSNPEIYQKWTDFMNNPKYIDYFKTNKEIWFDKLDKLKYYINQNNRIPRSGNWDDDNEKSLYYWICGQRKNYKKQTEIMKDEQIYQLWTQFTTEYQQYM